MMKNDLKKNDKSNQIIVFATHLCSFFFLLFIIDLIGTKAAKIKKFPGIDIKEFR